MELRDGDVLLRPFVAADLDALVDGLNDDEIARFIPLVPEPYTRADAEAWLERCDTVWATGESCPFGIFDAATGELLGSIEVRHGGMVGYWVAAGARGRGIASPGAQAGLRLEHCQAAPADDASRQRGVAASRRERRVPPHRHAPSTCRRSATASRRPCSSSSADPAQLAGAEGPHLVGEGPDVDRLGEIAVESLGEQPRPLPVHGERRQRHDRNRGWSPGRPSGVSRRRRRSCPAAGYPSGSRPGAPSRPATAPTPRSRPRPCRTPFSCRTSRASRRFFSLSSTISTSTAGSCDLRLARGDTGRARGGPLSRAGGRPPAARDAAGCRGGCRLRDARRGGRRRGRRSAGRRRHRHPDAADRHGRGRADRRVAARESPGHRRRRAQPVRRSPRTPSRCSSMEQPAARTS